MMRLGSFLVAALVAIGGCAGTVRTRAVVAQQQDDAPPPTREEVVVYRPGFVFIHGRWDRDGGRWHWKDGYYDRERPGYVYIEGRWEKTARGHVWVDGQWRRRDGVVLRDRY